MINLRPKETKKLKGHSKSNSTDTLCSQRRTKFLSVVSSTNKSQFAS